MLLKLGLFWEKLEFPMLPGGLLAARVCGNLGKCILNSYGLILLSGKLPNTASEIS